MTFSLTPRQTAINRRMGGPQRHSLLVGGARSGKTFLIVRAILTRAIRAENSRHLMARLRANAARASLWLDTLPKVARTCFPGLVLQDHRLDGFVSLPQNGSEVWIGGLDDRERVEKILGQEYATIYLSECSQLPYGSVTVARTRLAQVAPGLTQRMYYDLNPVGRGHWTHREFIEHVDPETRQPLEDPADFMCEFLNPLDNAANLTPAYLKELERMPERRRRRFFLGEYVDEIEGALWTLEVIDRIGVERADVPENLRRVVVAVDPSGTAGDLDDEFRTDDVGIVVVGIDSTPSPTAYVLADLTCSLPPEGWGKRVVDAFDRYRADAILYERNFGGDMARFVISQAAPNRPLPLTAVTASRGKVVRAEPVSVLYGDAEGRNPPRVRHVNPGLERLEDELMQFSTAGYQGSRSPNRADAAIWALTHLMMLDQSFEFAPPILVTQRQPSPDRDPAPDSSREGVLGRRPSDLPTQVDWQAVVDRRGW